MLMKQTNRDEDVDTKSMKSIMTNNLKDLKEEDETNFGTPRSNKSCIITLNNDKPQD